MKGRMILLGIGMFLFGLIFVIYAVIGLLETVNPVEVNRLIEMTIFGLLVLAGGIFFVVIAYRYSRSFDGSDLSSRDAGPTLMFVSGLVACTIGVLIIVVLVTGVSAVIGTTPSYWLYWFGTAVVGAGIFLSIWSILAPGQNPREISGRTSGEK